MSESEEQRALPTYCFGDEITIRMTFTHDAPIFAMEVVYTHHDESTSAITLNGNPEPVEGSRLVGEGKRSTIEFTGVPDESLMVGTYSARRLKIFGFTGGAELLTPRVIGDWPTLYLTYGVTGIREAIIELEPEQEGGET